MRARASEGRVLFIVNTHPRRTRMQRTFGVFVAALACTGVGAAGAQAAQPFKPQLPAIQRGNDGIARAFEAGRISEAQYALERVRAIAEPVRARLMFGDVETPERYEATIIFRDLVARLDRLSYLGARGRPAAARAPDELVRLDPQVPHEGTQQVRPEALRLLGREDERRAEPEGQERNRVPDWIDLTRKVTSYVWSVEVGRMGYRAPKSDRKSKNHGPNGKLDVYVADVGAIGLYGYCTTDDPEPRAARRHLRLLRGRRRLRALPVQRRRVRRQRAARHGRARVLPRGPVRLRLPRGPLAHGGHGRLDRGRGLRHGQRQPPVPEGRPARHATTPGCRSTTRTRTSPRPTRATTTASGSSGATSRSASAPASSARSGGASTRGPGALDEYSAQGTRARAREQGR